MSEDPYLVSEMTVPLIKGIQKADVAACVKHFAVNGQETNRLWVDTIVDKRTLYELYLPGFDAAVNRAHSYSIMGAYNMLNGQHCCESRYLLGDILRKEWGYDGTVISDWGGVHDTVAAAESELDLEMSITFNFDDYCMANPLKKAVEDGKVKEKHIDKKVANLLRLMYRLKMLPGTGERKKGCFHSFEHIKAARKTAEESVILLKNDKTLLPLKLDSQVAVIGRNATAIHSNGGGSAEIKAIYEVTPLKALMNVGGGDTRFVYEPGYVLPDKDDAQDESWQETSLENAGSRKEESADETLMARIDEYRQRAVKLARENRQTIIFAGLNHDYDIEGRDKSTLKLPYHQDELIEAVLDANPDTIVVIMGGAPVEMPWLEKAKAVVWYYYSGLEGAMAVADVLTGKVNPSGKLPETFPKRTEDIYSVRLGEFGKEDRLVIKDCIADAFLQNTLLIPEEYSVIATLNLNGDYVSDQLAAMVGGIGIAPGANINYKTGHAIFEATHGTAPNIAGKNVVNPCSIILSAVMMLGYFGWTEAAALIEKALENSFLEARATHDLARFMPNGTSLSTTDFTREIVERIEK